MSAFATKSSFSEKTGFSEKSGISEDSAFFSADGEPFVMSVKTDNAGVSLTDEFQIPFANIPGAVLDLTVTSPGLAAPVDITAWNDAAALLQLSSIGTHVLTFTPHNGTTINSWHFNNGGDKLKALVVSAVGDFEINIGMGFSGCTNMTWTADIDDVPLITSTTLEDYFKTCSIFNGLIGNWPVGLVSNFTEMLRAAKVFNQSLDNFDMSSATTFFGMFWDADAYNQAMPSWVTPLLVNTAEMFRKNTAYNQAISFSTALVTTFNNMFNGATPIEQDFGGLNIGSLTTASLMFNAVTLTTVNYGLLLVGWEGQSHNNSVTFSGGNSTYSEGAVDSGTTDGTTANKLVDSTQNFITTVTIGDAVHNTTDDTFALVTAIDSDTTLSLSDDIMITAETYTIQGSEAAKARARLILDDSWTITDGGAVA